MDRKIDMVFSRRNKKQSWSIIILCYNEAETIKGVNDAVQRVLKKISTPINEVIIVDDGSRDGSSVVIKKTAKKFKNVKVVTHESNLGIGLALRSGYKKASCENICVVPADGQFDPNELVKFSFVEAKTFISFYRKKQNGYNLFRVLVSKTNNWINENVLGIRLKDVNWVKVFKRAEIAELDLKLNSALVASEICAKLMLRGNGCIQSSSIYHARKSGTAKGGSLKTVWPALLESLKLLFVVLAYKYELRKVSGKF